MQAELTLEQLFPTKLFETDPDQVQKILAQLPVGAITYVFRTKSCRPIMILHKEKGVYNYTYYTSRGQIYTGGDIIPRDVIAIACVPTPVQNEHGLKCHSATLSSVEWYPGWDRPQDAIVFQAKQKDARDAIRRDIATWAHVQPCKVQLKGRIIQGPLLYMLTQVKNTYVCVYGKEGAKFRIAAIAASNARERFIIWLRRTDSIWRGVPIDICRMIARMCRVWLLTA
jgi:hypothetical protein